MQGDWMNMGIREERRVQIDPAKIWTFIESFPITDWYVDFQQLGCNSGRRAFSFIEKNSFYRVRQTGYENWNSYSLIKTAIAFRHDLVVKIQQENKHEEIEPDGFFSRVKDKSYKDISGRIKLYLTSKNTGFQYSITETDGQNTYISRIWTQYEEQKKQNEKLKKSEYNAQVNSLIRKLNRGRK